MATPKSKRIGIMIILVVMVVGTVGSFAVMILDTQNQQTENQQLQGVYEQYQTDSEAYQAKLDAQAAKLSETYYPIVSKFASRPSAFAIDSVKELKTTDLIVGDGDEITDTTPFAAYYIGWNPDGKIFDQSISDGALIAPLYDSVGLNSGLSNAGLIEGWITGLVGMKIGGVRELAIPSDLAYGEAGQGDDIPPNTPLKFIVMAIAPPETIAAPEIPQELLQ